MFRMFRWLVFFFTISSFIVSAQQTEYVSPLNIPLRLSGNFCEVRPDHFHSGIDIKTNGHEGLPVFAVDKGYVSRVKVSADGFGKVIYITHPGSKMTVYAHLHSFMGALADTILHFQYKKKSFEVELFPDSLLFPVWKGQQIGWSGNSGGSDAPHLHFEIRDATTEEPLNPLLNGFTIADTIKPFIQKMAVYQYNNHRFAFQNEYALNVNDQENTIDTFNIDFDTVGMAFNIYDEMNDTLPSTLGIYSATLLSGNDTIYHYAFDRMNFSETRNVNGYIDYLHRKFQKVSLHRCFTLPGTKFNAFRNAGKGYIVVSRGETMMLRLKVTDANDNGLTYYFYLKNTYTGGKFTGEIDTTITRFSNKEIALNWNDASILIADSSFFEDIHGKDFIRRYSMANRAVVQMEPAGLPLRKKMTIKFKPSRFYNKLLDKLVIIEIAEKGNILRSLSTTNKKGIISATTWNFGKYTFAVDTTAPVFSEPEIVTDTIFNERWLQVKVKDDRSGVKSYEGWINEEWALFEYDRKNGILAYKLSDAEFKINLYLEATDQLGNKARVSKAVDVMLSEPVIK